MRLTRYVATAAVGIFALAAVAQQPPTRQKGSPKLEGTYTIVKGEEGGKPIPAERIKGSVINFTKDKITGTDKDRKEFFAATYTLDATQSPWRIKMKSTEPKEAESIGLVKREGSNLVIIYALPGGPEPKSFKTVEGQQMFTLRPAPKTAPPRKDK